VALLFIATIQYEARDQELSTKGFARAFGESLSLFRSYFIISFLGSCAFWIVTYFIHKKLSLLFIPFAIFLNVLVAVLVGLILDFVLWITQMEAAVSIFQKVFMIATISTIGTTVWLLGDMFKVKKNPDVGTT
jgi:hypothetical protein